MERMKRKLKKMTGKPPPSTLPSPPMFASRKQARMSLCERPAPLGERKRPLTPPNWQGALSQQEQSLFFSRLPIDIRRIIYQFVLASPEDRVLHIASSWRRLFCHRCDETNSDPRGWLHKCWKSMGVQTEDGAIADWSEDGAKPPRPSFFGLLRSCSRIYTESIDILYSDNVLDFRQTRTIIDLKATIPTERLHSIRSVQLDCPLETEWLNDTDGLWAYPHTWPIDIPYFWEEAFKAIVQMKGLRSLRVALSRRDLWLWEPDHKCLVTLLRPMIAVRVPVYKVEFSWHVELDGVLKEFGELPFSIEIKGG